MSKRKAIAILAIIAMVLTLMPAAMFGATNVDRLAGANRIETALKICDAGWKSADTVILAAADEANLVDALAAGPLAAQENAPILVTYKNSLNADVKAKIAALGAKKVIVVGAVSDSVVEELKAIAGVTVEKISGKNRIETANLINAKLKNVAGTFVVGYLGLPDALSVASYAAANNFAIVIAKADGTVDEESLLGATTYIVGGTARVADIDGVTRFAGSDRLETNAAVAEGLEFDFGKVYVANGRTLVDALAVAPLAAKTDSFVLLVEANKGKAVEGMTASTQIIAVGGTAAVPQKVLDNLFGEDDGEFGIKSVTAPNLIQLKIELTNTDYDKDDLTDVSNYELEAIAKDEKQASVIDVKKASVKGTTLTLTLEGPIKNETTGKLTVDRIITGEELVFENIKFSDHDIPTIEEVNVIGKDTVKFVFSEPINIQADAEEQFDFEQDGSSFSVKDVISIKDGLEANVVVYDNFKEGDLTVKVGNGLEDYAGFNIIPKTFKVDVVEDTEAPYVVGYKDAKRDQVVLIFNEDIEILSEDEEDYYHTNKDNIVDDSSIVADTSEPDCSVNGNELTLKFSDNKLPEGIAYVYVKSGAVSDLWDNENSTIKTKVEIDVDNTKPTIKSVEWKDKKIVVSYSEPMGDNATDRDKYTLVDPDGDEVTIRTPNFVADSKEKKVEFELRDSDPKAGTYELTVEKVEDKAGNAIAKTTVEVNITGTGSLSMGDVTQALYDKYSSSRYRIYLEFGKKLATEGNFSVLDPYKYEINGENLGKLDADDKAYVRIDLVDDGKTVRITTDYDFDNVVANPAAYAIQIISRIADINGNYTEDATSAPLTFTDISSKKIGISGAAAKSATTVEVTFKDGFISSYNVGDFVVWQENQSTPTTPGKFDATDKEFSLKSIAQGADPDKAIITLVDKKGNTLPADAAGIYVGTKATTKSKNAAGRLLEAGIGMTSGNGVLAADKIAPGVKLYDKQKTTETAPQDPGSGKTDKVEACWAKYDKTSKSSLIYIEFNEAIADVGSASGIDVKINNKSVPFAKITDVSVDGAVLKIQVENNEAIEAGDTIILGDSVIRDIKGNRAGKIEVSVEYEVDDTATIPAYLTPDAGKSGITTKTPGANGSKEVDLVITVANFNNDGLPGYEAEDFSVEIDGAAAVDFTDAAFSGFTDNGDGTYSVTFTGDADAKDYSFTISVGGVEIVTADTVTTPDP